MKPFPHMHAQKWTIKLGAQPRRAAGPVVRRMRRLVARSVVREVNRMPRRVVRR